MRLISIIEYDLERSIKYKFRPLSNKMTKRLFDDGPISSFAAKIDLAYALDITADATHQELNKISKSAMHLLIQGTHTASRPSLSSPCSKRWRAHPVSPALGSSNSSSASLFSMIILRRF